MLGAMLKACAAADGTYDPAAFFNALANSWAMMNNGPVQLIVVLRALLASSQYANLTKEPKDRVAPSALSGSVCGLAVAVPVGPAVATAVVSIGKGDKGASKNMKKMASPRGQGKSVTFDEEGA